MGFYWTVSIMSMSLVYCVQNLMQYFRCGLTSAENEGRITFLDLLAALLSMQPMTPAAFFAARSYYILMFNFGVHQDPQSFSVKLLSIWAPLNIYWCMGLFLPWCRTPRPFELHVVPVCPFLHSVWISLEGPMTLWHIRHCPQFYVISANTVNEIMHTNWRELYKS